MAELTNIGVFARRLAQARARSGLSQRELGIKAGLDRYVASPRINQYERGKHAPSVGTAKQLAEALGVPPAFLYTEDELLATLLLRWNDLSVREKKALVKQAGATEPKQTKSSAR